MVEYILLLAVVVSLVLTLYNSEIFRRLFGRNGEFGRAVKASTESSYRYALKLRNPPPRTDVERDISNHPSYHDPDLPGTRFFGPRERYPLQ
jgi:hypothetical protein